MKKLLLLPILIGVSFCSLSQTLYIPNGTAGISTSTISGNVGIGTSAPQAKLQVQGTIMSNVQSNTLDPDDNVSNNFQGYSGYWALRTAANNSFNLDVFNGGSPITAFNVVQNGNVGIGTSSPAAKLQVHGTIMSNVQSNTLDPDDNVSNNFQGYGGYWALRTATNNSFNLDVFNGGLPITAFNIVQNGNVGIGTSSPAAKFQVHGTIMSNVQSNTLDPDDNLSNNFQGYGGYWALRTATNNSFNLDVFNGGSPITAFNVVQNGNVGIGTATPGSFKLAVAGKIWGQEVQVALNNPGPDYVFDEDYALPSLDSVQSYIHQNKHLPEVPSAKEMEANGINVSEMNMLLLKKVEELTLYVIEAKQEIRELKKENSEIRAIIKR